MRVFAIVLLGMSLVTSPLLARNAGETEKEATPAAAASPSAWAANAALYLASPPSPLTITTRVCDSRRQKADGRRQT